MAAVRSLEASLENVFLLLLSPPSVAFKISKSLKLTFVVHEKLKQQVCHFFWWQQVTSLKSPEFRDLQPESGYKEMLMFSDVPA